MGQSIKLNDDKYFNPGAVRGINENIGGVGIEIDLNDYDKMSGIWSLRATRNTPNGQTCWGVLTTLDWGGATIIHQIWIDNIGPSWINHRYKASGTWSAWHKVTFS